MFKQTEEWIVKVETQDIETFVSVESMKKNIERKEKSLEILKKELKELEKLEKKSNKSKTK